MKDNKKKYFAFFESYDETLSIDSDERYGRMVRAMSAYAFRGEEPNFEETNDRQLWLMTKPIIDNGMKLSKVRSESGAKGGYAKAAVMANSGKTLANSGKTMVNDSGEDMDKDKDKEMEWEGEQDALTPPQLEDVVLYFDEHDKGKASDPNKFFSHFDSLGWVSNGQPIVNWQSRADMWISEDVKKSAGKPPSEPFVLKTPTKEEYAEMEAKRQESEYERFKGLIDLIRREPGNIGREPLKKVLQNGTLDKYPDLKKDAESLFFTTSLQ